MTVIELGAAIERRSTQIFALLAATAFFVLLWQSRGLTFFLDEWSFLERRALSDPAGWLVPHNEHWSTLPVVAYRGLVETFGIGSYLPYQLLLLGLHLVVAALMFRLVRRRLGGALALLASIVVLYFGSGYENLYWAFQVGFLGATAAGLAAFDVLDGSPTVRRAIALVVLLVVGLASSGIGLFFLAGVAVEIVLRRDWRRWFVVLGVPFAAYDLWYLAFGQAAINTNRNPFALDSLLWIPWFLITGAAEVAGAVTGLGPTLGLIPAVAVVAAVVWLLLERRPLPVRFTSAGSALLVAYTLIAVTRAGVTLDGVHYTRYTYVTGMLLIVALSALVEPWLPAVSGLQARARLRLTVAAILILELSVIRNGRLVIDGRYQFEGYAGETRALVTYALPPARPPGADLDRSLHLVPSPRVLEGIVAAYGSPLDDWFWGNETVRAPQWMLDQAREVLAGDRAVP